MITQFSLPRSQTPFENAIVSATSLPQGTPKRVRITTNKSAMELPQQVRSQMEFGNEGGINIRILPYPVFKKLDLIIA